MNQQDNQFTIPKNVLENFDIAGIQRKMATADWFYPNTDDPISWLKGHIKMLAINKDLGRLCELKNGRETAKALWGAYTPKDSIIKPDYLSTIKTKVMNDKNFDYLKNQILKMGFGEGHSEELKTKLQSGAPEFVIGHTADYGKDNTAATLQFKKSANTDMYFFNSYNLHLKNAQHPEPIKQTFYTDDHFSLKEGYNLLAGRAVLKEKENKEGQKYTAWFQLDFKESDKNGNFKLHPYHSNYGYDLPKQLEKHSIKELNDPAQREYMMKALERGNRQQVTLIDNGQEKKIFMEAAPQFKSLNFYDAGGNRLKAEQIYENKSGQQQGQTVKQQAEQLNEKANNQSEKQGAKKENQKQNTADGEEGGAGKQTEKRTRRNKQSIS